jgi:hypothetical protein
MEQVTGRRSGRPPVERRRVPMAMRITPELRDKLVARAEATGRSITQEMELLLEQGLRDEDAFKGTIARMYGRQFAGVLLVLAQAVHLAGSQSLRSRESRRNPRIGVSADVVSGWLRDPWAYDQAVRAANTILEAYRPEGEIVLPPPPAAIEGDPPLSAEIVEAELNPGPATAAGVLALIVERLNRETWIEEIRDLLGDLADADVKEPQP